MIELEVVTPERHVLADSVESIELPGKEGYLGVLPGHAPLLTELGVGTLSYTKFSDTKYLTVIRGFAEVLPDRVIVLAEISERAEEINIERSRTAEGNARARLAKSTAGEKEWIDASLSLERALVRLQTAAKAGATEASPTSNH